jgi:IMP cyclohydrolase
VNPRFRITEISFAYNLTVISYDQIDKIAEGMSKNESLKSSLSSIDLRHTRLSTYRIYEIFESHGFDVSVDQ